MTLDHIIYAAGLFDGEGTVTLTKMNAANQFRAPGVSLSSTTYTLVDFMKSTFGGQIIKLKRAKSQGHKQAWHWQTYRGSAINVLEQISPYLREPEKRRRALLILEQYKVVTPRNGKYTPEQIELKEAFEATFFAQ
jgi:hypothetical protein